MIKMIDLPTKSDERGSLSILEVGKAVPFSIKRVYYLFDSINGASRGFHAHKRLEQIAICIKGSCEFLLDDGSIRETVLLNSPRFGLYVGNLVWREMHNFSDDCVLLVLASEEYDEDDYIRCYEKFLEEVKSDS